MPEDLIPPKVESPEKKISEVKSPEVREPPKVNRPPRTMSRSDEHKICLGIIGLLSNVILGSLAYSMPQLTNVWRACALIVLFALLSCLIEHAMFLAKYASDAVKNGIPPIATPETPEPRAEAVNADMEKHPALRFVKFMFAPLIVFSLFVTTISVPDYLILSPKMENGELKLAPSCSPQIKNLMVNTIDDYGGLNVVKLFWGAFYFCSVTFATVGYGDVSPGENAFWGRLSAVLMTLFLFIALPLFGKYILNATIVNAGQAGQVIVPKKRLTAATSP